MSDISFKQAKELVEGMELAQLSIKKAVEDLNKSSKSLDEILQKQNFVMAMLPQTDKKLIIMKIIIALNIGFICGIIFTKYFL